MMNQLKQQFAIINRIKCLVKKTGSSFFRRRKDPGISEDIAKNSKSAYDLSHLKQKTSSRLRIWTLPNSFRLTMTRFSAPPSIT